MGTPAGLGDAPWGSLAWAARARYCGPFNGCPAASCPQLAIAATSQPPAPTPTRFLVWPPNAAWACRRAERRCNAAVERSIAWNGAQGVQVPRSARSAPAPCACGRRSVPGLPCGGSGAQWGRVGGRKGLNAPTPAGGGAGVVTGMACARVLRGIFACHAHGTTFTPGKPCNTAEPLRLLHTAERMPLLRPSADRHAGLSIRPAWRGVHHCRPPPQPGC